MDYHLAMAASKDAADRQARKNGRKAWNQEDYNLMCQTFDRLYPEGITRAAIAKAEVVTP